jgi:glycosyltransferase involved in cell wall biosynthesis
MIMAKTGIMHLIDTLDAGGAERVAVNLVNMLPREKYTAYMCTTRSDGILSDVLLPDVGRLSLHRRYRFDLSALHRLVRFTREHNIQILHAHSTSLMIAAVASMFPPFPRVIWHDHFGRYATEARKVFPYWLLSRRARFVIAVNQSLAEWAMKKLGIPEERVLFIPNFVIETETSGIKHAALPEKKGLRIVCVANFRPQKDHVTLIRAIAVVAQDFPEITLLLVGSCEDVNQFDLVEHEIKQHGLEGNVFILGERTDVQVILKECDIGVLSSNSEGLPLALLEYGMAGLPVVATNVGQCSEVLGNGKAGYIVPPGSPKKLSEALFVLIRHEELRRELGRKFIERVKKVYRADTILEKVCNVYETVLHEKNKHSRFS